MNLKVASKVFKFKATTSTSLLTGFKTDLHLVNADKKILILRQLTIEILSLAVQISNYNFYQ